MKKRLLRCLGILVTLTITICILLFLTALLEKKTSRQKYDDFFSQEADFDVLFMGTSHVMNAELPMELWHDFGIVSYNFGTHASQMPTTYWLTENVLDYTTPKVVVIDCFELSNNTKTHENFSYIHQAFDAFPISINKIRMANDLLDDDVMEDYLDEHPESLRGEERTKIGLLWNFSVYHSRWNELSVVDFKVNPSCEKGAESRLAVASNPVPYEPIEKTSYKMEKSVGSDYLCKLIEDLQSRGIKVILTYLPFPAAENKQKEANYVYDIADKYSVEYINFLDMNIVDFRTDMYDEVQHLNTSGARKVTKYMGQLLSEKYGVPDRRGDDVYLFWNEDYDRYCEYKNEKFSEIDDLYTYLMYAFNDDITIVMHIANRNFLKNDTICSLLYNLHIDANNISDDGEWIVISDRGKSVEYTEYEEIVALLNTHSDCDCLEKFKDEQLGITLIRDVVQFDSVVIEGSGYALNHI